MSQWRNKHRFGLQVGALVSGLASPFALYLGLVYKLNGLAIAAFAAIAVSMLVVVWAG